MFPISRDPPEGGTVNPVCIVTDCNYLFPISRDPPEGGTRKLTSPHQPAPRYSSFQFLGIPPKGEPGLVTAKGTLKTWEFPISRDPPEGGTIGLSSVCW